MKLPFVSLCCLRYFRRAAYGELLGPPGLWMRHVFLSDKYARYIERSLPAAGIRSLTTEAAHASLPSPYRPAILLEPL